MSNNTSPTIGSLVSELDRARMDLHAHPTAGYSDANQFGSDCNDLHLDAPLVNSLVQSLHNASFHPVNGSRLLDSSFNNHSGQDSVGNNLTLSGLHLANNNGNYNNMGRSSTQSNHYVISNSLAHNSPSTNFRSVDTDNMFNFNNVKSRQSPTKDVSLNAYGAGMGYSSPADIYGLHFPTQLNTNNLGEGLAAQYVFDQSYLQGTNNDLFPSVELISQNRPIIMENGNNILPYVLGYNGGMINQIPNNMQNNFQFNNTAMNSGMNLYSQQIGSGFMSGDIPIGDATPEEISNWKKVGNKGFLCDVCGKTYTRKYGLKIHMRIHTGFKPLRCKTCNKRFGDPSNMAKHVRLHSLGDTPYKCSLCPKVLVRRRDLERHMKSRHNADLSEVLPESMGLPEDLQPSSNQSSLMK